MKKLVLMLSAALISMAAQATIYVTGGSVTGAPKSWDPANPLVVEEANGVYTFKAEGGFKISTTKGDWNSFNLNAKTLEGSWNKATTTATANLKSGDVDISAPMDGVEITYEVASDLSNIKATLPEGSSFGDPVSHTYALHGQLGDGSSWKTTAMTENNGAWEWTGTVVAGEFGIQEQTNGKQTAWISADGTTAVNAVGVYAATYNGSNWKSSLAGKYTFSLNPTTMKLTITGQGTTPDPDPDPDPDPTVETPENVYLTGDFENVWSTSNPIAMVKDGNKFSVETELKASSSESTDGYFTFITAKGANWDAVNGSDRYGAQTKDEAIALSTDVAYKVFKAGVNASAANSWKLAAGTYIFTIDFDSKTVRVEASGAVTPDPDPDPDPDPQPTVRYALHGTITGDPSWASVELTENSGKYEWTGGVEVGEFGIKIMDQSGKQTGWISAPSADEATIEDEGTYNTSANGESNWSSTLEGNYTFSFNPTANTLTITKYEGDIEIVKSYAFKGTITNGESTEWISTAMTEEEDGTWSWSGTVDTGDFGIQYLENGVQKTWYASADESSAIAEAGDYNAKENGTNWALSLTGDVTLKFNPTTLVLTVVGGIVTPDPDPDPDPDPTVETPENVYLTGNFENSWSTSNPITMEKEGNKFTAKAQLKASSSESTDGYFTFITAKGEDWNAVNGSDRYGAQTKDEVIALSTDVAYKVFKAGVDASAANSWKLAAGTYLFTIDFESKTVRVDLSDGVENIEVTEEEEVEYYNLQGVKVANPSNGVYIRVINGKATKVVK